MNTIIWICFVLALWGASIAVTYVGAWNRGRANGIQWAGEQVYGQQEMK